MGGLRSHGLKAVRLGAMERVRPDLQDWSFDIVSQSHPLAPEVEMLQTEINDLWRRDVAGAFGEICDFCCDGVVLIRRQLGLLVRAKA